MDLSHEMNGAMSPVRAALPPTHRSRTLLCQRGEARPFLLDVLQESRGRADPFTRGICDTDRGTAASCPPPHSPQHLPLCIGSDLGGMV